MDYILECIHQLYKKYSLDNDKYGETYDVIRAVISNVNFENEHKDNEFPPYRGYGDSWNPLFNSEESLNDILASGYIGQATLLDNKGDSVWEDNIKQEKYPPLVNAIYLDHILEVIAPNITYLTYRKIERDIVIHRTYTKIEYYQNNEEYLVQLISIEALLQMLKEKNVLLPEDLIRQNMAQFV